MSDIRLLTVGDIHLADKAPGSRTDDYTNDIFTKVEEIVDIAINERATHVLLLGDIFDSKYASRVSHKLVLRFAKLLSHVPVPVYILVGNHDLAPGQSLESLEKQPITILGMLPNVTLLLHDPAELDPDVVLFPVPGVKLDREENAWLQHFVTGSKAKRKFIVAHQLIVPDVSHYPKQAQRSFYAADEIAAVTDADLVLYGDVHSRHGLYKKGNKLFSNYGSICRLSVADVDHVPEVVIFTIADDEKRTVSKETFVLKSVRPKEEAFRLEEHYEKKDYQADLDETVGKLTSNKIHKFSVDSIIEDLRFKNDAPEPVRETAIDLIESIK